VSAFGVGRGKRTASIDLADIDGEKNGIPSELCSYYVVGQICSPVCKWSGSQSHQSLPPLHHLSVLHDSRASDMLIDSIGLRIIFEVDLSVPEVDCLTIAQMSAREKEMLTPSHSL